eukprot:c9703_g1_i2.p1 GENE.c9703_g1_i2~~c9703_g1_i2.p1  ORF type:complete len:541 (+),score=53.11 c9703_g1_i2:358-1980(+)
MLTSQTVQRQFVEIDGVEPPVGDEFDALSPLMQLQLRSLKPLQCNPLPCTLISSSTPTLANATVPITTSIPNSQPTTPILQPMATFTATPCIASIGAVQTQSQISHYVSAPMDESPVTSKFLGSETSFPPVVTAKAIEATIPFPTNGSSITQVSGQPGTQHMGLLPTFQNVSPICPLITSMPGRTPIPRSTTVVTVPARSTNPNSSFTPAVCFPNAAPNDASKRKRKQIPVLNSSTWTDGFPVLETVLELQEEFRFHDDSRYLECNGTGLQRTLHLPLKAHADRVHGQTRFTKRLKKIEETVQSGGVSMSLAAEVFEPMMEEELSGDRHPPLSVTPAQLQTQPQPQSQTQTQMQPQEQPQSQSHHIQHHEAQTHQSLILQSQRPLLELQSPLNNPHPSKSKVVSDDDANSSSLEDERTQVDQKHSRSGNTRPRSKDGNKSPQNPASNRQTSTRTRKPTAGLPLETTGTSEPLEPQMSFREAIRKLCSAKPPRIKVKELPSTLNQNEAYQSGALEIHAVSGVTQQGFLHALKVLGITIYKL